MWRVRDRATFEALAGARRHRVGAVWVRAVRRGAGEPPRVAYAVGRRVGNAVERNRVRRRLRAAVDQNSSCLLEGVAYLVGADRRAMTVDFAELVATLGAALRQCSPASGEVAR